MQLALALTAAMLHSVRATTGGLSARPDPELDVKTRSLYAWRISLKKGAEVHHFTKGKGTVQSDSPRILEQKRWRSSDVHDGKYVNCLARVVKVEWDAPNHEKIKITDENVLSLFRNPEEPKLFLANNARKESLPSPPKTDIDQMQTEHKQKGTIQESENKKAMKAIPEPENSKPHDLETANPDVAEQTRRREKRTQNRIVDWRMKLEKGDRVRTEEYGHGSFIHFNSERTEATVRLFHGDNVASVSIPVSKLLKPGKSFVGSRVRHSKRGCGTIIDTFTNNRGKTMYQVRWDSKKSKIKTYREENILKHLQLHQEEQRRRKQRDDKFAGQLKSRTDKVSKLLHEFRKNGCDMSKIKSHSEDGLTFRHVKPMHRRDHDTTRAESC